MTDDQFQALSRSVGNLAAVVADLHSDVTDLKNSVEQNAMPFLRRIDNRLAVVESRWSNIEGRLATSEMRQTAVEQIVYRPDDPSP